MIGPGSDKNTCINSDHILREIWPEVNFKDYLNLKDYLTSIILKISHLKPIVTSSRKFFVLNGWLATGAEIWNSEILCQGFFPAFEGPWASFTYEPIQPNKNFCLPRVLELFGSQQRILIDKVSYFGFNGCLTTVETFFVEVFPSVPMAIPFLITLDC